jgi:hypothetical protein
LLEEAHGRLAAGNIEHCLVGANDLPQNLLELVNGLLGTLADGFLLFTLFVCVKRVLTDLDTVY